MELSILFVFVLLPRWLYYDSMLEIKTEEERVFLSLEAYAQSYLIGLLSIIALLGFLAFKTELYWDICIEYWWVCGCAFFLFLYTIFTYGEYHYKKEEFEMYQGISKKGE